MRVYCLPPLCCQDLELDDAVLVIGEAETEQSRDEDSATCQSNIHTQNIHRNALDFFFFVD